MSTALPDHLTHYYVELPFRSLTDLDEAERRHVLAELAARRELPRRLKSDFYFEQRLDFELRMHAQFLAKGGRPRAVRPQYAVLGDSEIWARIASRSVRLPLSALPSDCVSFTWTDSWSAYVDQDLSGNPIPRKPQYGMVYRLDELPDVLHRFGWPGDRWKTEEEWAHDVYVEAQIWCDESLAGELERFAPACVESTVRPVSRTE